MQRAPPLSFSRETHLLSQFACDRECSLPAVGVQHVARLWMTTQPIRSTCGGLTGVGASAWGAIDGEVVMPKFLIQASYTVEGFRGLRKDGASGRRDAVAH